MNLRKKGTGSEVNITSTMIWGKIVIQLVHMRHILGWHSILFYLIVTLTIVYKKIIIHFMSKRFGCRLSRSLKTYD
jgi:hypothetical protein